MIGAAVSEGAIGSAEQVSALELDTLTERVCRAYSAELHASGNRAATDDLLVAGRDLRIGLLVADVVGCFRELPSVPPMLPEPLYRTVLTARLDSHDSVQVGMHLHRALVTEISRALGADPIEVGAVVMARILTLVSEAFDAMRSAAERLCEHREQLDPAAMREHMTSREAAVFQLLMDGASRQHIADELHLSPRTVKNHVTGIGKKLGGRGRTALRERARELQILVAIPVLAATSTLNDVIAAATTLS